MYTTMENMIYVLVCTSHIEVFSKIIRIKRLKESVSVSIKKYEDNSL